MFNPEKYVTRAEAAEISYRMTQTPQALAFHNALYRQQVEQKHPMSSATPFTMVKTSHNLETMVLSSGRKVNCTFL